jgi:tripartite-type tricarboxylate transporter receptor subunit TctC
MSPRKAVLTAIVAISAVTPLQSASAQNYPTKPIHLIVPYPAGGGTDFFARLVGQKMSELVGQPIVVENKPGAATNLGADFVAKAPPDGYTILLGDVATYAANPSLYKKLPFDPAKDFAPVTLTARFLSVLVTNPNKLKVNSVAELIDQAKREPGKIDIAHAGVGNPFHLAAVLFQQAAGIKLNEVPYRGAGPAVQGLLGGDVHMMFVDYATARSHIAAGTLKRSPRGRSSRVFRRLRPYRGLAASRLGRGRALCFRRRRPMPSSSSYAKLMLQPSRTRSCARR